ncbi:DUF5682 family protein [Saccharibacillus sp. CPCC 101409]|uniref:DUF5682 family protein n=1 Tax=Saccharibacillus sp. CPCC 101409 TaxID=3058041 RepID=UPI00267231B6|nr:DUF5682 family protein [Saccharibacillus sp. CPCC 101409]MDO3411417.1 DUF5682 family protein [Saccharibacillus sp. CPCC 101409]
MDRLNGGAEERIALPPGAAAEEEVRRLDGIFAKQVFDLDGPVVYFPIRHHSPACSHHLLRTFADYKPDIVLIEGPESGSPLISVLADPATRAPVSLYYGYEDGGGRGSCYFPLLDYSPEYAAIREAAARGIPARFIDLDYRGRAEDREEDGKASYQDESLLAGSAFIERLCRASRVRSFDELWERAFEIGGLSRSAREFARGVFAYCTLSRMTYTPERLRREGDLDREARMRARIEEARAEYGRVLVVTGGFHTYGLIGADGASPAAGSGQAEAGGGARGRVAKSEGAAVGASPKTRSASASAESGVVGRIYPMVYTFQEADRLNGYASGMPHVGYYDRIWKRLSAKKPDSDPYASTALDLLARLGHELRGEAETVSTSDAIEAYGMLQGLAALRGKSAGGAYELLDAVTASFVKGERTLAADRPLEKLLALMTGDAVGEIAPSEFAVPIVEDFKARAAACRLNLKATGRHRRTLELYARPAHREASRLLHCAEFLGTDFAKKESGPDWISRRDMNLVRETWTYSYSSRVEARLIENSIYGGTVAEAAQARIEEEMDKVPVHHSGQLAHWLLRALVLGLEELAGRLFDRVETALRQDGSFLSLCDTLDALDRILGQRRLLGVTDERRLSRLSGEAFEAAVSRIGGLNGLNPDEQPRAVEGLKLLHMLSDPRSGRSSEPGESGRPGAAGEAKGTPRDEAFRDRLGELLAAKDLSPRLEGAAAAILVRLGEREPAEISRRARAYMLGSPEQVLKTAEYLQGVFSLARDALLEGDTLLGDLSGLLERLAHEDFLRLLPELRLAFTFFTPPEASRIAERVANLYGVPACRLEEAAVDERDLLYARRLDEHIRKEFAVWKLEPE